MAAAALGLGAIKHRRDAEARRVAMVKLEAAKALAEANDARFRSYHRRGVVSAAQAEAARLEAQRARAELEAFEGRGAR